MADERPPDQRSSEPGEGPRRRRRAAWLILLAVAVLELVGHYVVQARVVEERDWDQAAAVVREGWQEGDLVVGAPEWTDPLVRRELGDLISLEAAGRGSRDGYERLWVISARGHLPDDLPEGEPALEREAGALRVLRWTLDTPRVLYRFTDHVPEARVTMRQDGRDQPCRWQEVGRPRGGGLGAGPIIPAARHVCDPRRPWLWVGVTVQDTLELEPRYCIWTHPAGPEPIRVSFPSVPLGEELVLGADYYYEHERDLEHGPTQVAVLVDGEPIASMTHNDGDGWKRMVATTPDRGAGGVTIEVRADNPDLRTLCWSAYTREAR